MRACALCLFIVTHAPISFVQVADLREFSTADLEKFIARNDVPPLAARRLTRALAAVGAPVGDSKPSPYSIE